MTSVQAAIPISADLADLYNRMDQAENEFRKNKNVDALSSRDRNVLENKLFDLRAVTQKLLQNRDTEPSIGQVWDNFKSQLETLEKSIKFDLQKTEWLGQRLSTPEMKPATIKTMGVCEMLRNIAGDKKI